MLVNIAVAEVNYEFLAGDVSGCPEGEVLSASWVAWAFMLPVVRVDWQTMAHAYELVSVKGLTHLVAVTTHGTPVSWQITWIDYLA